MTIVVSESEFEPSCDRQHCRPPHQLTRVERFVRAVSCLLLFAAMGVIFAIGLSHEGEQNNKQPPRCGNHEECK